MKRTLTNISNQLTVLACLFLIVAGTSWPSSQSEQTKSTIDESITSYIVQLLEDSVNTLNIRANQEEDRNASIAQDSSTSAELAGKTASQLRSFIKNKSQELLTIAKKARFPQDIKSLHTQAEQAMANAQTFMSKTLALSFNEFEALNRLLDDINNDPAIQELRDKIVADRITLLRKIDNKMANANLHLLARNIEQNLRKNKNTMAQWEASQQALALLRQAINSYQMAIASLRRNPDEAIQRTLRSIDDAQQLLRKANVAHKKAQEIEQLRKSANRLQFVLSSILNPLAIKDMRAYQLEDGGDPYALQDPEDLL